MSFPSNMHLNLETSIQWKLKRKVIFRFYSTIQLINNNCGITNFKRLFTLTWDSSVVDPPLEGTCCGFLSASSMNTESWRDSPSSQFLPWCWGRVFCMPAKCINLMSYTLNEKLNSAGWFLYACQKFYKGVQTMM